VLRSRGEAPKTKAEQIPLQLRLPRDEVRAIKVAAAEREQTSRPDEMPSHFITTPRRKKRARRVSERAFND
jgi:hypothetical protein